MWDPVLAFAFVLAVALVGGAAAVRLKQPAVLGELVAGVVIGNLGLLGVHRFAALATDPFLDTVAQLGVILLLFEAGYRSTVRAMLEVGWQSLAVATLGVVASVALGWGAAALLLPSQSTLVHAFLGCALGSSSVSVSARVLTEMGAAGSAEARLILGSAVVDDALGLVLLAVLTGMARAERPSALAVGLILFKAVAFLAVALTIGVPLVRRSFELTARLRRPGMLLGSALVYCLAVALLSVRLGLAAIVGAYIAGLVLEEAHLRPFGEARPLEALLDPLTATIGLVFFTLMGMRTHLAALAAPGALALGALLLVAALAGKCACALGVGRGADRVAVALGLLPRGEVTLVYASLGVSLGVLGAGHYAALMLVVLGAMLMAPSALQWRMTRP